MSFHFQPAADSSDEGEVDISAWQAGAKKADAAPHSPAPVAPMYSDENGDDDDDENVTVSAFQQPTTRGSVEAGAANEHNDDREDDDDEEQLGLSIDGQSEIPQVLSSTTRAPSQGPALAASGFTSINRPMRASRKPASESEEDDKIPAWRSKSTRNTASKKKWKLVPAVTRGEVDASEYEDLTVGSDQVLRVRKEMPAKKGYVRYMVEFGDNTLREIPFEELLEYDNGQEALDAFETGPTPEQTPESQFKTRRRPRKSDMTSTRPARSRRQQAGFVSTVDFVSDNEASEEDEGGMSTRRGRKRKQAHTQYVDQATSDSADELRMLSDSEDERPRRRRKRDLEPTRRSSRAAHQPVYTETMHLDDEEESSDYDDSLPVLDSDLPAARTRRSTASHGLRASRTGERQSGRATRHRGGMTEVGENDIFRSDSDGAPPPIPKPKVTGAKEIFPDLPRNNEFRMRHMQQCETCAQGPNFGKLVFCQGCTLAYHKSCLGRRNGREHLVTKVGDQESVLQCRRCIALARTEKKDTTAPDQGICADCHEHGSSCQPFRPRKTPAQEQKERDENDGEDPIYNVDESRINQVENVMFRCVKCWRGFHFEHLPSKSDIIDIDSEVNPEQRFREYSRDWLCKDCLDHPTKVSGLIAWKPIDEDSYDPALGPELIDEDDKAYLVKWDGMSYFQANWMPGAWVWGVSAHTMRKAFSKRDDSQHPKMRTEDAIPEDYLRADIVLDIKYTSYVDIRTEEIDKARIREVDKALIKYKGLGYEDAVWEKPPSLEDGDRWTDFVTAYNDWVLGRYVKVPSREPLKKRLEKARTQDFAKLEKTTQPETLEGGQLMKYQIEGLNWLYFKWFTQKNAILADEMGLGKTIQIIGFLATLVADWNCFPFLVVVPNSTCPNWRREIKRWAPSLRVVAYYGSKQSRELTFKHELYPENSRDLKCHVVVTSYDAAADDDCRKFFRSVPWQGLVVDEGQRLKNEKSILYSALAALKAPFKMLLTGTPLQNNARELFNLLQFLDDSHDAAELEQEFADLDQEKITKLHDMIRPFFLRRTKAQVLTFLPPMAQIILPTTMTIVQRKLYRTILAKNPDLMKAIFSSETTLGKAERASLSNILMQLRKCLCHPFVYSNSIEERTHDHALSHRNLVDASSKLKLLEMLLPKLKERGHRVLIFSQFLDMLDMVEDFLDGMELRFQRLDGSINALSKQKRIDEFNAPDSPLFAFLLSTRAGGVGINLATADTVIILDPDFNPHQDIQALSRAHRIGQHKKVLCFQLVTRDSAEEKIMQMGRKKLALDHVLIQEMDADDADQNDLVSVLQHGASKIFEDDTAEDIIYDSNSVDRLLDRSHIENTHASGDKSAESQFSTARVWANDSAALTDNIGDEDAPQQNAPDPGVWAKILTERERVAAEEAAARADAYGRGRRARNNIDYGNSKMQGVEGVELTPAKRGRVKNADESDTDFQDDGDVDDNPYGEDEVPSGDEVERLQEDGAKRDAGRKKATPPPSFKRARVPEIRYLAPSMPAPQITGQNAASYVTTEHGVNCAACRTFHAMGKCPLKLAGVEVCNLCGIAHFGAARTCPHIQSETQVRAMLEALKYSTEQDHVVAEAKRYLRGLKGNLVQLKKQKEAKRMDERERAMRAEREGGYGVARPGWR